MTELTEIRESKLHSRGVFAKRKISKGEVVETCLLIIMLEEDRAVAEKTILNDYCFQWGEDSKTAAIALGNGSLYNHSYTPNCVYEKDYKNEVLIFRALMDIPVGEELTINYNWDPKDKSPLWFTVKDK